MLSLLQIRLGDENSGHPALKFHQPDTPSLTQAFAGPGAASGDGWHVTVPSEWRGAGEAGSCNRGQGCRAGGDNGIKGSRGSSPRCSRPLSLNCRQGAMSFPPPRPTPSSYRCHQMTSFFTVWSKTGQQLLLLLLFGRIIALNHVESQQRHCKPSWNKVGFIIVCAFTFPETFVSVHGSEWLARVLAGQGRAGVVTRSLGLRLSGNVFFSPSAFERWFSQI